MKNHNNIQPTQKFNPPTLYRDQDGGTCYIYDPAAWRNNNKRSAQRPPHERHGKSEKRTVVSPVAL